MDQDRKVRTLFLTYEADDESAETFMVLLGMVAENFKGVKVVEFQDDTVFADGTDAMAALHEMATSAGRLTDYQRRQLEEFGEALNGWDGSESP